jgi:phosphatidylethanolamine-binding protein (PEBP) family uncharacterized protein
MKVYLKDQELIDNKIYPILLFDKTKLKIVVSDIYKDKLYTLMMVDEDPPSRSNPINKYMIHLLVINNKTTLIDYAPPRPSIGSGPHRYHVLMYEQPNKIADYIKTRPKFNLDSFVSKHKLKLLDKFMFQAENK